VWTSFDPKTGQTTYRETFFMRKRDGRRSCDQRRRHNWPATSFHQPTGYLIAPLVQAVSGYGAAAANLKATATPAALLGRSTRVPAATGTSVSSLVMTVQQFERSVGDPTASGLS